jgi:hypothetical protein
VQEDRVGTPYVRTIARFFGDDEDWQEYDVHRVYGRTRDEWRRSGQDMDEFDRLLTERPNGDRAEEAPVLAAPHDGYDMPDL